MRSWLWRSTRRSQVGVAIVCVAVSRLAASPAAAADNATTRLQEPIRPTGIRLSLRSGVGIPKGNAFAGSGALAETISGYVPLRVDLGLRIAHHFYIGAVGQLALVLPDACTTNDRCRGTNTRVGLMAAFHFLPTRAFDPWLGVGAAYETLSVSRTSGGATVKMVAKGFELIAVDIGGDARLSRSVRVGPVVSTSVGRYTHVAINGTSTTDFEPILHGWLMFGVRGAFDL